MAAQTGLVKEAYGPRGDPARHRSLAALEAEFERLPAPAAGTGTVRLLVLRQADGERYLPDRVEATVEEGFVGDGWSRRPPRDPNAQITVMRHDIGSLIANGQSLALFGDNVLVDLDLSETGLPVGSRVAVGGCTVEVTPEPHNGCAKYAARFGHDALRFINLKPLRPARLRGIHWRVLGPGVISVGDSIEVIDHGHQGPRR